MVNSENETQLIERFVNLASPLKQVHDTLTQMASAQLLEASADNLACEDLKQINDVRLIGDALVDACNQGAVFENLSKDEKEWLHQVIAKYSDAENNFENSAMPTIKDSLINLLLLQSEARRNGWDVTPLDLLLPVGEMQCAAGTKSEFIFKSAALRGGDDAFFTEILQKEARKLVEQGYVRSGNEKHVPTALMYILGVITEEQALQLDDLYYYVLPLPAHLCFEVLGELFKHYGIEEKMKTIAKNREVIRNSQVLEGVNTTAIYEEAGEIAKVITSLSRTPSLELNAVTLRWQDEDTEQIIADEQVVKSIVSPISYQDIQLFDVEALNELPAYLNGYFKTILQRCGRHSLDYSHYQFQEQLLGEQLNVPGLDVYSERLPYVVDTLFAMKIGLIENNDDIEEEVIALKIAMAENEFKNFGISRYIAHIASLPEEVILNKFDRLLEGYCNFEPIIHNDEIKLSMTRKLVASAAKLGRFSLAKTLIDRLVASDYSYSDKIDALANIIDRTYKKRLFYYYDNADICSYALEHMDSLSKHYASIDALDNAIDYFNKVFINNPNAALDAFENYKIDINRGYGTRDKTLLHYAVDYGDIAVCERLIDEFGIGLNNTSSDKSWTPLHMACDINNNSIVRLLLEKGADYLAFGEYGEKPIHIACLRGNVAIVELLHNSGCNLNVRENSKLLTPLLVACKRGRGEVVEYLVDHGASATLADHKGRTALHFACREGDVDMCTKLLTVIDDVDIHDNKHLSPLQYACRERNADVVRLLLDHLKNHDQASLYAYRIEYNEQNKPCLTKPNYESVVITNPEILGDILNAITPANQNIEANGEAEEIVKERQNIL